MKTGILFAGQGQQFLFMGQDLAESYPLAKEIYAEAEALLGFDLLNLDLDRLNETQYTQPAIFVLNYALSQILDIKADFVAGLSLGEYSALTYAGVLDFKETLSLVFERAKIMQAAFPAGQTGMMALLKTDIVSVEKALEGLNLAVCNYNTPSQIVVGGKSQDIEAAKPLLKERGIRLAIPLKVSSVSHMHLMRDASEKLRKVLMEYDFKTPKINFINNLHAEVQSQGFVDSLARQISEMTRMYESIQKMIDLGVTNFIEIGPKGSLSKFVKEINPELSVVTIYNVKGIEVWKNKSSL